MSAWNRSPYAGWRNSLPPILTGPMAVAGSASLFLRIAAVGIGFLQSVLTARLLGVHDYGVFAFITAVVSIAATIALFGMAPLSVRELARLKAIAAWEQATGFFRASRITVFSASVLTGAVISGFALLAPPMAGLEYRHELALAGLIIPPTSMILLFQAHGRGLGAVIRGQVPNSLIRPGIMVAAFATLYFGAMRIVAFDAVLVFLFASFVALIFAAVTLRHMSPEKEVNGPVPLRMRKHLGQAASFFAMSVAVILQTNGITLLLVWLAGPAQAGLFQPIALLTPVMVIGLDPIAMPLAPRIAHLWEMGDIARLRRTLGMATLVATGITVCVIAGILLLAPFILGAFGKEFATVRSALLWIAFAQIISAAAGHVDSLLAMTSHQRDVLKCQIIQLLVSLVLGVVLIPVMGAEGAAISLAAGIVTFNGCALIYAHIRHGFVPALPGALAALIKRRLH